MIKLESPIEKIEWIDPNTLTANNYNPNFVFTKEMRLLELSIKKQGWLQPILITRNKTIIDGFHRHTIAKRNNWLAPCAILDLDETERKLLTVRINRAKGTHIAVRMSELIQGLLDSGVSKKQIAEEIGADEDEVDILALKDIFEKFDLDNHKYSKAWIPSKSK
jgi:ParB-like chromosome segregation protein Spo0J